MSPSACVGAAAGEDAKIRLWRVPEGGLQDTLQEPEAVLRGEHGAGTQLRNWQWGQVVRRCPCPSAGTLLFSPGHTEKIYSIRFHPVAADLLVSSSYDMTVRIWDLGAGREVLCLQGHTDQVGERITGGPQHSDVVGCHAAAQLDGSLGLAPELRF